MALNIKYHGVYGFLLVCFLMFLSLRLIMADEWVDNVCRKTPEPDLCSSCLDKDKERITQGNIVKMTRSMVECTHDLALDENYHIEALLRNTTEPGLVPSLKTCNDTIFSARLHFYYTYTALEYVYVWRALTEIESAFSGVIECIEALQSSSKDMMPSDMAERLDLIGRHYLVSKSLFGMIKI